MNCGPAEKKLVAYLDGKLTIAERREFEAHLDICVACREQTEGFRSVWDVLGELPVLAPSPAFDNRVGARVQQELRQAGFWGWIIPSPRMAFAATALLVAAKAIRGEGMIQPQNPAWRSSCCTRAPTRLSNAGDGASTGSSPSTSHTDRNPSVCSRHATQMSRCASNSRRSAIVSLPSR